MTMNDHWGYSATDRNLKSTRRLIHLLVRSASMGANYLLNVGPTPLGEILPDQAQRLRRIGAWLRVNGVAVYGTRSGVIPPTTASVSTQRGDVHYVHILDHHSDEIALEGVPETITSAHFLADGAPTPLERRGDKAILLVPEERCDPYDTVVVLR